MDHHTKDKIRVRRGRLFDVDSGRETWRGADFKWENAPYSSQDLICRNNAKAAILYDFGRLTNSRISRIPMGSGAVAFNKVNYAVIVGKSTSGRMYKMIAHTRPNNTLYISNISVYKKSGSRYKYKHDIKVRSSYTFNVDALQMGNARYADIWWHMISDQVGFVEKYNSAKIQLLYCI